MIVPAINMPMMMAGGMVAAVMLVPMLAGLMMLPAADHSCCK
jgi:hypothetical protein